MKAEFINLVMAGSAITVVLLLARCYHLRRKLKYWKNLALHAIPQIQRQQQRVKNCIAHVKQNSRKAEDIKTN